MSIGRGREWTWLPYVHCSPSGEGISTVRWRDFGTCPSVAAGWAGFPGLEEDMSTGRPQDRWVCPPVAAGNGHSCHMSSAHGQGRACQLVALRTPGHVRGRGRVGRVPGPEEGMSTRRPQNRWVCPPVAAGNGHSCHMSIAHRRGRACPQFVGGTSEHVHRSRPGTDIAAICPVLTLRGGHAHGWDQVWRHPARLRRACPPASPCAKGTLG